MRELIVWSCLWLSVMLGFRRFVILIFLGCLWFRFILAKNAKYMQNAKSCCKAFLSELKL